MKQDVKSALVLLVGSILFYFYVIPVQVKGYEGQGIALLPSFIPGVAVISIIALSIFILLESIFKREGQAAENKETRIIRPRGILAFAIIAGSVYLIDFFGYLIGTSITLSLLLFYFGVRDWKTILLMVIGVTSTLYFLFQRLANVMLPPGRIF